MALLFYIFAFVVFGGKTLLSAINLWRVERTKNGIVEFMVGFVVSMLFGYGVFIEYNLLINYDVVIGTTKERCYRN